ncbi:hypothetical protein C7212DRAFT_361391 [Tuber magnatum]|uniref:Uncharacterized protein n=1 Tax=Tuber magnatum TaxID=42249 RepID=A0A317SZZ1_9PEZI|nr:hypothetical protein C7212DRAFT_361391 [Tuber magnatum]
MVPESTLPDTSSEVREQERLERPEVQVPATQAVRVTVRLEEDVHDIRDDVRRLATRFDGLEERFDGRERRLDESDRKMHTQFDHVKEWCEGVAVKLDRMDQNWKGMEALQRTILAQLAENKRGEPIE